MTNGMEIGLTLSLNDMGLADPNEVNATIEELTRFSQGLNRLLKVCWQNSLLDPDTKEFSESIPNEPVTFDLPHIPEGTTSLRDIFLRTG